jgi:formylglycine-generating enzyme required for sulfatase activity
MGGAVGCGGASGPPPASPAANVTRPIPVPVQPRPEENAVATRPAAKGPKPKPAEVDPFADEHPKNLFEITAAGPSFVVDGTTEDVFIVEDDVPEVDSTQFEILSTGEAARGTAGGGEFALPEGFTAVASFGTTDQGLPLRIRDDKTGAMMALVLGGPAIIGSDEGPPETRPAFTTLLETFYMDVTEVTLEDYAKFRDDVRQKRNTRTQPAANDGQHPRLPALGLPWGIALAFAHWAGKELPTEAEFEKAARGPEGFRTPWGNGRAVWPNFRTPETIARVGEFPTDQSVYGIFDLAGNAREWCSDWYSDTAHEEAARSPERALRNWSGPKKASVSGQRVVKGNGPDWSAWHRQGRAMTERHSDVGFRCVLRVKAPPPVASRGK